jgi:hypothetical protein
MLPYLIAGAIGFGIGKLFEEGGETFGRGGRITTNEDILRSFLTSEKEIQINNLATFHNPYDNEMVLKNGGTFIADRIGRNVNILENIDSKTINKNINRLSELAEEMGYNVSYVSKLEEGGETFGRGGITNEDILRSFLTSEKETQTNNLATFYSTLGAVMLLRNYGTLIAKRNGRRVEITNVK